MGSENKQNILGHLAELRSRLLKSVIAVIITSIISFAFADYIFQILKAPVQEYTLVRIEMTEMIGIYMKVCLVSGLVLAMPFLVYQFLMFVAPALNSKEKKYTYLVLPWIGLMFAGGVVFAYFVLLPPMSQFLFAFGSEYAEPQIRIGNYISILSRLLVAVGFVFELPVITTFLARLGVITSGWLARRRKLAIIFAFILAAVITPTIDPVNQCIVAGPLIVLYEMSIWLAKLVQRRHVAEVSPASSPV